MCVNVWLGACGPCVVIRGPFGPKDPPVTAPLRFFATRWRHGGSGPLVAMREAAWAKCSVEGIADGVETLKFVFFSFFEVCGGKVIRVVGE